MGILLSVFIFFCCWADGMDAFGARPNPNRAVNQIARAFQLPMRALHVHVVSIDIILCVYSFLPVAIAITCRKYSLQNLPTRDEG